MLRTVLAVAALLLVIAGAAATAWIYPHLAWPDEPDEVIAARWAQVDAWAAPAPGFEAPTAHLRRALDRLQASELRGYTGKEPLAGPAALDDAAREALAELIAWSDAGGGLGGERCVAGLQDPTFPAVRALALARVALHGADGPDAPQVGAALRLGDALRARGGLLLGLIGFAIADEARATALRLTWPKSQVFAAHRPRRDQVFPLLAREAYCQATEIEALSGQEGALDPGGARSALVSMERELAVLRWYEGQRLVALARVRGDLGALARTLAEPPLPPKSLLIPTLTTAPDISDLEAEIAAYDAYVDAPTAP